MPPTDRFVISFAAEPPQQALPYGRWAEELREHFVAACADIEADDQEIGEPGDIRWFPDRTFSGRTYVPAVARTEAGYELSATSRTPTPATTPSPTTSRRAPTSPVTSPRRILTGSWT